MGWGYFLWAGVREAAVLCERKKQMHYWESSVLSKFCLLCSVPGNGNWLGGLFARWGWTDIRDELRGITNGEKTEKVSELPSMLKSPEKVSGLSRATFTWTQIIRVKGAIRFKKAFFKQVNLKNLIWSIGRDVLFWKREAVPNSVDAQTHLDPVHLVGVKLSPLCMCATFLPSWQLVVVVLFFFIKQKT